MSGYCSCRPVPSRRPGHREHARGGPGRARRPRRMVFELRKLSLPVGPQLGAHAALDEGPAHRRGLALQLGELGCVFGRKRIRDGGEKLRDLHDRPFEAPSATASSAALRSRSRSSPNRRAPANRAAMPPILAPTRASARRGRRSGSVLISHRSVSYHPIGYSWVPSTRCRDSATAAYCRIAIDRSHPATHHDGIVADC